jgi:subtilisin
MGLNAYNISSNSSEEAVMTYKLFKLFGALALLAGIFMLANTGTTAAPLDGQIIPGQFIILTADGVSPATVAADYGLAAEHIYGAAVRGFSAAVPNHMVAALQADARVIMVDPVRIYLPLNQVVPTGVDRIETDKSIDLGSGVVVDLDVAIIDTGISSHPDLTLAGGRNFAGGPADNFDDKNGHGTHVAGTVGAIDNGSGVVGVAPGVRLWAVRVCTNICPSSNIIAGIDWVTERKASGEIDFAAANYSISSADSDNDCDNPANAIHAAICGLVDEGVVFVMAAGNDNRVKVPFPVAFSVSAVADFDGKAGGAGEPTCRSDTDDTLANFSNYGEKVDIAAPGVCILSTWNDGGYNTISGTSMAAPHVTGAVALYLHANNLAPATSAAGVAAIEQAIIDAAHPQGTNNHVCSYDDARIGGPMLFVNHINFGGDGTCEVAGDNGEEPPPPGEDGSMHVASVTVSLTFRGPNARGTATVTIVDEDGDPVSSATVTGDWFRNGIVFNSGASGTTGSNGVATIDSGNIRSVSSGEVIEFCVTNVTHSTLTYDDSANVETCGSATVP